MRKRDIKSGQTQHKACLNIDSSYDKSYAPVAKCTSILMSLTVTIVHDWHAKHLDYVAALPQAPFERDLYMKIPNGIHLQGKASADQVLKLHNKPYGQNNAGKIWNNFLRVNSDHKPDGTSYLTQPQLIGTGCDHKYHSKEFILHNPPTCNLPCI